MGKSTYRSIDVQQASATKLLASISTARLIVAIDVAKYKLVVAFADDAGQAVQLVRVENPSQTPQFWALIEQLKTAGRTVQIVLEPTGTYGKPILHQAHLRGIEAFLVSPKRTHDAAELFDGVPSKHDPKDATIIARLHAQKLSRVWQPMSTERRELRALVAERELYARPLETHFGKLEALHAEHWPELDQVVEVRTRTSLLRWLVEYGDPAIVRAAPEKAAESLRTLSKGRFKPQTIAAIVASAGTTAGLPMSEGERRSMRALVSEIVRLIDACTEVETHIEKVFRDDPKRAPLIEMLAPTTLAVLLARVGDPLDYASASAFEKACGLNLREQSSGEKSQRGLRITKRGPGIVRKYLFLLALRTIARSPEARAWYQRRGSFRESHKLPAVVALMRKLTRAIWHVARGERFDVARLFDLERLRPHLAAIAPLEKEVAMTA